MQIMNRIRLIAHVLILLCFAQNILAQNVLQKSKQLYSDLLTGEKWWGGFSVEGTKMPFSVANPHQVDLVNDTKGNQGQPFFVSDKGRYIWCEDPFVFKIEGNRLTAVSESDDIELGKVGSTMKDAFLYASKKFFPSNGLIPDTLLFVRPQYNTWIELMYNQNQEDILNYAQGIVGNNFPPGVLMIDDNWQMDYGNWEFNPEKFSDPKAMCDQLHRMGFKIMMWVCPFISPDCEIFRDLQRKDFLIKRVDLPDEPYIAKWWNGYSAVLDLSNPGAMNWLKSQLRNLQVKYGVDGFKLDAGDARNYVDIKSYEKINANEHSERYAEVGLDFKLNEYRACWKMAGLPLVQRLRDKNCNWVDLQKLIPDMLALGIMGYSYSCPDMIGGGDFLSFLDNPNIDQDLVVRSAQVHALMPMMQFSVAPWRILDETHLSAVKKAVSLHVQFKDIILDLAKKSSVTGEPIVRPMEYNFPNQGFSEIKDQFMLGDEILVAPVVTQGQKGRHVVLPSGNWMDDTGKKYKGGQTINIDVPIDRLPYFKLVKN